LSSLISHNVILKTIICMSSAYLSDSVLGSHDGTNW